MYDLLKRKIGGMEAEIIEFVSHLVKCPSPSFEENRVADMVEEKMKELDYDYVLRDEAGNVIGIIYGREANPSLLINAHMDVADSTIDGWEFDLYAGDILKGQLRGLGASDCKSGVAAAVYAGAAIRNSILPLKGNLIVAATVGEESGYSYGIRYLMEKTLSSLNIKPEYAIMAEPTNLAIYRGHSGWVRFEIVIHGNDHFVVSDATKNIFEELNKSRVRRINDEEMENFCIEKPVFDFSHNFQRGVISVNKRLMNGESITTAKTELRKYADVVATNSFCGVDVEIAQPETRRKLMISNIASANASVEAWSIDAYHPLVERARQIILLIGERPLVAKWKLPRAGMGTAGGVLVKDFNIPTIGYGPGIEENCHVANESVPVDNIIRATFGISSISYGLIGIPVCGWTSDEI